MRVLCCLKTDVYLVNAGFSYYHLALYSVQHLQFDHRRETHLRLRLYAKGRTRSYSRLTLKSLSLPQSLVYSLFSTYKDVGDTTSLQSELVSDG